MLQVTQILQMLRVLLEKEMQQKHLVIPVSRAPLRAALVLQVTLILQMLRVLQEKEVQQKHPVIPMSRTPVLL